MKLIVISLYAIATIVLTVIFAITVVWYLTEWPISRSNLTFGLTTGFLVGAAIATVAVLIKLNGATTGLLIAVIGISQILFTGIFYYILSSWAAV